MPAACLPATGIDNWTILLLVIIAAVLMAAGVVAVKKSSGRVALAIAPLILLGLVIAAPAPAAQAVESAIPDFTASEDWTYTSPPEVFNSDAPTPEQVTLLAELEALAEAPGGTFSLSTTLVNNFNPAQFGPLDGASVSSVTGVATVPADDLIALADEWGTGSVTLSVTVVFGYPDQCGKPLQTTVLYTGTIQFST
jgi:LPXTG-motif cell wall-anchored protein